MMNISRSLSAPQRMKIVLFATTLSAIATKIQAEQF